MIMNSTTPRVSVIMPVRNGATTVAAAIRSLQIQTLSDWELIVIDDGSTDQTSSVVDGLGDARIRLYRETASGGLATRLNQAVALTGAEFIARMDADDICFPERLARQVERLQSDPELDVVGCGAVVFTDEARLVGELNVGLTHGDITAKPFLGFPLPHPTWCGRARWFRSNPYDANLLAAEDQDLLLRSFRSSRFGSVNTVLLGYRQNHLVLKKLLRGRRTFIGCLWRYGLESGQFLRSQEGIAAHILKSAVDVAAIGLGLNQSAQLMRLKPVSAMTMKSWHRAQEQLAPMRLTN
jgi:glycosyltransferase involved in cell wall biosynthesis